MDCGCVRAVGCDKLEKNEKHCFVYRYWSYMLCNDYLGDWNKTDADLMMMCCLNVVKSGKKMEQVVYFYIHKFIYELRI